VYNSPGKKGARFRAIKRSVEAFRLALGGRRTLGAGGSVIPEIHYRAAKALLPSSRDRTIGGPRRAGEAMLLELHLELTRLANDQEILHFLTSKEIEKKERMTAGGWAPGWFGFVVSRATVT
jgi:hypothetical protein